MPLRRLAKPRRCNGRLIAAVLNFYTERITANAQITAALVKGLREKTRAGMMDAKKALVEN